MMTFLIGHRGAGKTSLVQRLKNYFPKALCLCLDTEIEKRHGSILNIFSEQGEAIFRKLESSVLKELVSQCTGKEDVYIALGAGFEGDIPQSSRVIWVQRVVDLSRFVFLDRPQLNYKEGSPLIPLEKFAERTKRYRKLATEEYLLPEGENAFLSSEESFFKNKIKNIGGAITLLPHHLDSPRFDIWLRQRVNWGVDYIELRDDLLSHEQIVKAIEQIPTKLRLLSFRKKEAMESSLSLASSCMLIDWPLENGEIPESISDRAMISCHSEAESFEQDLHLVSGLSCAVKWSPVIESMAELKKAHEWKVKSPLRSLLPRSSSGKWLWYRLLQKNHQEINFFREGEGSAIDQPSLIQWIQHRGADSFFAAVVGSPVSHSWTPAFHAEFFKKKKINVLAIDVSAETFHLDINFLFDLGLRAAAVTSPLKSLAALLAGEDMPINTLAWDKTKNKWCGKNTDIQGFKALSELSNVLESQGRETVVWGGGGVLPIVREVLPHAQLYAAQTGEARMTKAPTAEPSPQTLVWAGGESVSTLLKTHPTWAPKQIVDLNYRGDSPALVYAKKLGAQYYSGREMFNVQALEQQKFWSDYEWR